jgi:hypothetical protein
MLVENKFIILNDCVNEDGNINYGTPSKEYDFDLLLVSRLISTSNIII